MLKMIQPFKAYKYSTIFSERYRVCNHDHKLVTEHFYHSGKIHGDCLQLLPSPPPSCRQSTMNLLSVSIDLPFLDDLLSLASLTELNIWFHFVNSVSEIQFTHHTIHPLKLCNPMAFCLFVYF